MLWKRFSAGAFLAHVLSCRPCPAWDSRVNLKSLRSTAVWRGVCPKTPPRPSLKFNVTLALTCADKSLETQTPGISVRIARPVNISSKKICREISRG
jgi:hypothetical protein